MYWLIIACGVLAALSILATFRTKVTLDRILALSVTISWLLKVIAWHDPHQRGYDFVQASVAIDYVVFVGAMIASLSLGRWWHQWLALITGVQEVLTLCLLWYGYTLHLQSFVLVATLLTMVQMGLLIAPWWIKRKRRLSRG